MRKLLLFSMFAMGTLLFSCNSNEKETAASIAGKWCELNGKAHKATTDEEKAKTKADLEKFQSDMDAKYKGDVAFMKEVEAEVNKCEAASEGR